MALITELMVLPVPNPKPKSAFAAETGWMAHRLPDFEISRANAGVDVERVALVATPIGTITISYLEGASSYRDVAKTIRTTPRVFDQDMMMRGKVLHGMTEEQQKQKRAPLETAVLYRRVRQPRQPWHSFVAHIPDPTSDRWDTFVQALNGEQRPGFDAFCQRNGIAVFCLGRYTGDAGTASCIYLECSDDVGWFPKAVAAGGEFADWFAGEFAAVHGTDIRSGLPSPAIGYCWDWVKGEANEVVAPLYAQATRLLGE